MSAGTALATGLLIMRLAPPFRDAIVALVRAVVDDDEDDGGAAIRLALEAARRAAFIARQRR